MAFDPNKLAQQIASTKKKSEVISAVPKKEYKSPVGKFLGDKTTKFFRENPIGSAMRQALTGADRKIITPREEKEFKQPGAMGVINRWANKREEEGFLGSISPATFATKPERIQKRAEKLIAKDGVDQKRAYQLATEDVYLGRQTKQSDIVLPKLGETPTQYAERKLANSRRLQTTDPERRRLLGVEAGENISMALDASDLATMGFTGTVANLAESGVRRGIPQVIPRLKSVSDDALKQIADEVAVLTDPKIIKEKLGQVFDNVSDEMAEAFSMVGDKVQVKQAMQTLEKQYNTPSLIDFDKLTFATPELRRQAEVFERIFRGTFRPSAGKVVGRSDVEDFLKQATILQRNPEVMDQGVQHMANIQMTARSAYNDFEEALKLTDPVERKAGFDQALTKMAQVRDEASNFGRSLEYMKVINQEKPAYIKLIERAKEQGDNIDKVISDLRAIDINDPIQVNKIAMNNIEPTWGQIFDESRYINLLSSPLTQIVNATTNGLQAGITTPGTKLVNGVFDKIAATLTKRERSAYVREVPQYIRGTFNALPDGFRNAWRTFRGKVADNRPDFTHMSTGDVNIKQFLGEKTGFVGGARRLAKTPGLLFNKTFRSIPRALEASDAFFRTIVTAGEEASLAYRYKRKGMQVVDAITEEARKFDTLEDFVRSQPQVKFQDQIGMLKEGARVMPWNIVPEDFLYKLPDNTTNLTEKGINEVIQWARKKGYDAVDSTPFGRNFRVLNKRSFIPESKVKEIFEKAKNLEQGGKEITGEAFKEQAKRAGEEAIFRQSLDTANATGQGTLLTAIDRRVTEFMMDARNKIPGFKYFVPFIQTPMNIFKKGIEYSPLGWATLPGSTNKSLAASRAFIGSMVPATIAALDMNGIIDTTWAAPTTEREKELFYGSGRQPFSIKIGDKYLSYARLGPIAYPMAMYAAFKWYMMEDPERVDDSVAENFGKMLAGVGVFLSQQSYVEGISDLVDGLSGNGQGENGGIGAHTSMVSQPVKQMIPLVSLMRWTNRLLDPVMYSTKDDDVIKKHMKQIIAGIPFASQALLEPIENAYGGPTTDPLNIPNAFSPMKMGEYDREVDRLYNLELQARAVREDRAVVNKELSEEAKQISQYLETLPRDEAFARWQEIDARDEELADKIRTTMEKGKLTPEQETIKSLGIENGDRARFLMQNVFPQYGSDSAKRQKFQELKESGIITKTVEKQMRGFK